ncbi:extracellular solute-binding protein [Natronorubrum halalkaliphilum]|nr:extracellular solute-binding protein [Natronorubrum halalkaliphilum]
MSAALAIAGCLGDDDDGANLWHDFEDAETDTFESHLEAFNEDRDQALTADGVSELEEQLETALAADRGPQSFAWAHDWIGRYHDQEFVTDAGDDLEVDLESTYTEVAAEAVQYEGAVYGLPYGAETVTLMYNEDLVDSPPETVSEMESIMEDHHDPENGQYGLSYPSVDPYFVSAWVHAYGGYYYDEESGELGLENDETIEGVELLADSFYPYVPEDPDYESQVAVFNDGNAPFAINGPWQVGGFRDGDFDVTLAPLPTVDGGEPRPYTGVQMWYFTSRLGEAEDDVSDAVVDWTEYHTTNEDAILTNAQDYGMVPVHQDYVESDELGEDVEMFAQTIDSGIPLPTDPRMNQVWDPVEDALERVFIGDEEPREAFEEAAEQVRDAWD